MCWRDGCDQAGERQIDLPDRCSRLVPMCFLQETRPTTFKLARKDRFGGVVALGRRVGQPAEFAIRPMACSSRATVYRQMHLPIAL
eukprot:15444550-Alexandrium_andersonii.AAC.1